MYSDPHKILQKTNMKIFILFLILPFYLVSSECNILTYDKIIKIKNELDHSVIKTSTCNEEINKAFIESLSRVDGHIIGRSLNIIMNEILYSSKADDKNSKTIKRQEISVRPQKIFIESIEKTLSSNFSKEKYVFKNIHPIGVNSIIGLDSNEKLKIECDGCVNLGLQSIKVTTTMNSLWVNSNVGKIITAYKTTRDIRAQEKLSPKDFKQTQVLTFKKSEFLRPSSSIGYLRSNHFISKNTILKNMSVTSINLVRAYDPIKVTFKSSTINISKTLQARETGKLGDIINVYNNETKKNLKARITGPGEGVIDNESIYF